MTEIKPGKYKHFKGGVVEVLFIAHHSETLEKMVVYKCEYGCRDHKDNPFWVRPLNMFTETIDRDGKKVKRFERVEDKNQ